MLMMTDLEGVAGVVSFDEQAYAEGRYYDQAKRLLTAEVNAAVEGLLEVGVEEVLVLDGHGPGGIWFENLHPAAKVLHGRPLVPWQTLDHVWSGYDTCMIIGQHAMAGVSTGNLNHTMSSRGIEYYKLNGQFIGETAVFALYHGAFGRPLIFLSGDDAACQEAEDLVPGITTVSVKQGLGRNSAISLSATVAREGIRRGVQDAVERHRKQPVNPLRWEGPYILEKKFFHTDAADACASSPDAERVDGLTVRFKADKVQHVLYR